MTDKEKMPDLLRKAGGQDPPATSHSMQSEDDRAQMANPHLNEILDILRKNKKSFITDVEREIKEYFEMLDADRCLALVKIEETQRLGGSITAQQLDSYPFRIDLDFWTHLSVFMQQRDANEQQAPVRTVIDAGCTGIVQKMVQDQFAKLFRRQKADVAACLLQLERVRLCSQTREWLRSSKTPLTSQQLADVSSLDDEEIVSDILRFAPKIGSKEENNYTQAVTFIQKRLPQPRFQWQTKSLDDPDSSPYPLRPSMHKAGQDLWGSIDSDSDTSLDLNSDTSSDSNSVTRSHLNSITRSIVTNQFVLFLVEVLDLTTADISPTGLSTHVILGKLRSLRELSSFATTLGDKIATAFVTDLEASFTDQNEKLWKYFVLRVEFNSEPLVQLLIPPTERAKIVNRITGLSPQARKDLATKEHSKVKRCIEDEFHLISSGKYSWLKELRNLRFSDDDMAELLLDEHDACPWLFYTEVESIEVQTYKEPLSGHHLNGCAHSLLETGEKGLGSLSQVAKVSNTSSSASFQDIETITKLHKICGLAGFFPTSGKKETWNEFVVFEKEEVAAARVSLKSRHSSPATDGKDILERIIATLGGLCTAFEKAQRLDLCCNSYTVFCIRDVTRPPKIEVFRIPISLAWQLLEDLRSVLTTPECWDETAFSMLFVESSPLRTALQPLMGSHLVSIFPSKARRERWLHLCSLAAQFLSLGFLSYTQAHKDELFPWFLAEPLRRVVLCGADDDSAQRIEMTTRPLTCIGDMLHTAVICFRRLPRERGNLSQKHNFYANLADIIDTWGPAELLYASRNQQPFSMRIGGGILYMKNPYENFYHWSEAVDMKNVPRNEMDLMGKVLVGALHVNSACKSNYEELRERTCLQTLGTQEQSYRVDFDTFGFSLGQLFSVVVQASVKHSAGVSHKKADRDTAQHHVMSLLDYRSAVQVSYCTGICQRVRFRDMVADLLLEFGPGTVHSEADAKAWRQLLATDIVRRLKGDEDVILDSSMHQELLKEKVKEMFDYLFYSGMNDDRTLRVAWPSREDRHAYSPVPCSGTNAWANLLSDSTHISSYAYIAPHCLQADRGSTCQGGWEPATGVGQVRAFATRVQCVNAVKKVAELPHESICFFQLMRIMVLAQVHHPDGESVILRVILHMVRVSVVRRLVALLRRTGKSITQLQESRDGATRAEEVLIVCG